MWDQVTGLKEWGTARCVLLGEGVCRDRVGDSFSLATPHSADAPAFTSAIVCHEQRALPSIRVLSLAR